MKPFILLYVCLFSPSAFAAPLPLAQAMDEAFRQSPTMQKAQSAAEEAKWKRVEALSGFLPTVTGSASHLLDNKLAYVNIPFGGQLLIMPQIIPTTTYALDARLPIFDGFANVNRYRSADRFADAAGEELGWERFRLEREVVLRYYQALGARLLEDVAHQNLRTLEDHLRDAQNFKRAGVSTNYDVLRVEVQVSEARAAVLEAQDNVAVTRQRLATALGLESVEGDPVGTLPSLTPELIQRLPAVNPRARLDLVGLASRVDAYDHLESAASVHLLPKFYLFGDYQRYNNLNNDTFKQAGFRDAYQVGVGLSWNLFDGMSSIAKSKESIEQRFQAEKMLQSAQLKSREELETWRRKYLYYCSVFASRQSDVVKSRESVRLAREGRRVGARTNTDLLDAEFDNFRAQAGLVNAQLGTIEALVNLELATGQKIYNFY